MPPDLSPDGSRMVDYPPSRQPPRSASNSSLHGALDSFDNSWTSDQPLLSNRSKHERFDPDDLMEIEFAKERAPPSRRVWLTLGLVIIALLCADLWRGVGRATDQLSVASVDLSAPAGKVTTLLGDHGYNPEEKTVVVFVHHDSEDANANTRFFLRHALHDRADFIFVLNGESELRGEIPTGLANVEVIQRDNTCYDLGAHGEILSADGKALVKKYDKFILMNASVRGPFMPRWSRNCWTDVFTNMVTEEVKLVGLTMHCNRGRDKIWAGLDLHSEGIDPVHKLRHIQAMLLATDKVGAELLLSPLGLGGCHSDYKAAVGAEVRLSGLIWHAGYEVEAVMSMFGQGDNYVEECATSSPLDKYVGGTTLPLTETVFGKTKKLPKEVVAKYSEWASEYSSYENCPVY